MGKKRVRTSPGGAKEISPRIGLTPESKTKAAGTKNTAHVASIVLPVLTKIWRMNEEATQDVPTTLPNVEESFEDTMRDPDFRAEAEKRQLDLEITRGSDIQSLIEKIYRTPPAVVERVKKIVQSAE